LTCFDCRECVDAQGTERFCKEQGSLIGGLGWNIENFNKFFAHIDPRFARYCGAFKLRYPFTVRGIRVTVYVTTVGGAFKLRYPFTVRGIRVTVYVTTVDRLREVCAKLKGGSPK